MYTKLCGKGEGLYDGDKERQDIDSDNKDDDIERFDGFVGDINIVNVSQIEALYQY